MVYSIGTKLRPKSKVYCIRMNINPKKPSVYY